MFEKLFDKVDKFIDKFQEINTFEELSKITIDILQTIKETLCENLSEDMQNNEQIFDEIMNQTGLWKLIGEKAKKAMKDKKALLQFLLYISAIMNEFQNRLIQKRKEEKKYGEFNKIIKKYMELINEIMENNELSEKQKEINIFKLKKSMEKEIKSLDRDR
ncbi:MAG: hypothetical protein E7314_01880 [Clostridiales bacterium]|nr:hypothetical protein [Clostridiales bacterium]